MQKSQQPLPHHFNNFLEWLEIEKGLSSSTQENYARFLQKFLNWLKKEGLEDLKPHQINPEHIWKYRVYLARHKSPKTGKALKKSTQNYYLVALRSLLNFFANRDIASLPAEKIELPKEAGNSEVSFLDKEQLSRLLRAPDHSNPHGLRDRAILESLFSTGMRIAELVSLNRNQIKINSNSESLEVVIVGKGGRARTVYFSERAVEWLKKYLEIRDQEPDISKEKALFINFRNRKGDGRRLTARAIQKSIKKYAIKAGIPLTTTPHVLRHTFATDLLSKGVDLRTVQEFLGHKNITATQIYTHVTNKQLRDVHKKFHGLEADLNEQA